MDYDNIFGGLALLVLAGLVTLLMLDGRKSDDIFGKIKDIRGWIIIVLATIMAIVCLLKGFGITK